MSQINFRSIADNYAGSLKWKYIFDLYWPAYKQWLITEKFAEKTDLASSINALNLYMPEMVPTFNYLCSVVNADALAAQFLTGYQPPEYTSACAQAVMTKGTIQLVRNYDYNPKLLEGVFLHTQWNGKKVMGMNDCLAGLVDGINEDGLAVSITFGGRNAVGEGFGISFIIRYVLEFCSNVEEAVKALKRIPSHMAYNITVLDKSGNHRTVMVAPGKKALVLKDRYCTNHQGEVNWHANAELNNTVVRADFLKKTLAKRKLKPTELVEAFLHPPLYNTEYSKGTGTIYTAVYFPEFGTAQLLWKEAEVLQNINYFVDHEVLIDYQDKKMKNNKGKHAELRHEQVKKKPKSKPTT